MIGIHLLPTVQNLHSAGRNIEYAIVQPTRWQEVMKAVIVQLGDIKFFLRAPTDFAPATCSKLLISDQTKKATLTIKLAVVVDGGKSLVKATYNLEADGPLAFPAYEIVNTILASISVSHFPNVRAISKELSPANH